ncbi:hypothetical protein ABPG74_020833 [Tetrahymena malaccensis]
MIQKLIAVCFLGIALILLNFSQLQNAAKVHNQYNDCQYINITNQEKVLGPEDSAFYDEDTLISSYGNIYEIFFEKKDLKTVSKGGFVLIQGIKSGNIKAYTMEIRNYPQNVFLIPLGIYIRDDMLYAINHSFYSGGGDRVEVFKIVKVLNQKHNLEKKQQENLNQEDGESEQEFMFVLQFVSYTLLPKRFNGITNNLVVVENTRFFITDSFPYSLPIKGVNRESFIQTAVTYFYYIFQIKNNHVWDCQIIQEGEAQCHPFENSKSVLNNGISTDNDGIFLVADTILKTVRVYKFNETEQVLDLKQTIHLGISVDNINYIQSSNSFLATGTTKMLDTLLLPFNIKKVENNKESTPDVKFGSEIFEIKLNPLTKVYEAISILKSDEVIVGASGAQMSSNREFLFVNSFADKSLSICKKASI